MKNSNSIAKKGRGGENRSSRKQRKEEEMKNRNSIAKKRRGDEK